MIKRSEFLIREIRAQSFSNNSSFTDDVLLLYLNEAQNLIHKTIFLSNNESNIMKDSATIQVTGGTRKYKLPRRMYAENSVLSVKVVDNVISNIDNSYPLQPVSLRNFGQIFGYSIMNDEIWISSSSTDFINIDKIEVIYASVMPSVSNRSGKIISILGNVLTLSDYDLKLDTKTDYVTVVSKYNDVRSYDLEVISFNQNTGKLELDNVVDIEVGDFILLGDFSTNISKIPYLCEDYLKKYVERRIAKEDSASTDYQRSDLFTEREKADIASIFAESSEDISLPEFSANSIYI